MKKWISI